MEEKRSGGEGSGQITRCPVGHGKDARSHGSEWRRERIRIKFHGVPLAPVLGWKLGRGRSLQKKYVYLGPLKGQPGLGLNGIIHAKFY